MFKEDEDDGSTVARSSSAFFAPIAVVAVVVLTAGSFQMIVSLTRGGRGWAARRRCRRKMIPSRNFYAASGCVKQCDCLLAREAPGFLPPRVLAAGTV
jgi:hypothetical protein